MERLPSTVKRLAPDGLLCTERVLESWGGGAKLKPVILSVLSDVKRTFSHYSDRNCYYLVFAGKEIHTY